MLKYESGLQPGGSGPTDLGLAYARARVNKIFQVKLWIFGMDWSQIPSPSCSTHEYYILTPKPKI